MVITIEHPITKEKLDEALLLLNRKKKRVKKVGLASFFGSSKKRTNALAFQKKMRNEWN